MKKRKSNKENLNTKIYFVSGLATKKGVEYNVGRTVEFKNDENVTFDTVKRKFELNLEEGGFTFKFMWGWSLIEINNIND